jgi:hypothetical protein
VSQRTEPTTTPTAANRRVSAAGGATRRRLALVTAVALLAALGLACEPGWRAWSSAVADREMTITLAKFPSQGPIHRLEIRGEATLDGEADLLLLAGDTVVRSQRISGTADLSLGSDWYTDDARLVYRPLSATSGQLSLRYRFVDL